MTTHKKLELEKLSEFSRWRSGDIKKFNIKVETFFVDCARNGNFSSSVLFLTRTWRKVCDFYTFFMEDWKENYGDGESCFNVERWMPSHEFLLSFQPFSFWFFVFFLRTLLGELLRIQSAENQRCDSSNYEFVCKHETKKKHGNLE